MASESSESVLYQRANFTTHLPVGRLYSPSHFWLVAEEGGADEGGVWRVGFTKFATRLLGEMVDHHFDVAPGARVVPGQVIGWIEGFKALNEIACIATGEFAGENPALREDIGIVSRDPYGEGWLYRVRGAPDTTCVDVEGYRAALDATIDRLQAAQCRT